MTGAARHRLLIGRIDSRGGGVVIPGNIGFQSVAGKSFGGN
jgi:hypothetical protein